MPKEIEQIEAALESLKFRQQFVDPGINKAAQELGCDREVKGFPANTHGQKVFTDGKGTFISKDWDAHSGGVWKMFDRNGNRLGTYDRYLRNRIGD